MSSRDCLMDRSKRLAVVVLRRGRVSYNRGASWSETQGIFGGRSSGLARVNTLLAISGSHGVCGCKACYDAGVPEPRRPWLLSKIWKLKDGGLALEGTNLYSAPGEYGRKLYWLHDGYAFRDKRYDATNAEITPEAMDAICRYGCRTELQ